MINLHGNFRFALDDVKIRDQITVRIDEKSRAQAAGRAHLHDGLADLFDEILHVAGRRRARRRLIKLRRRVDVEQRAGGGWRQRVAACLFWKCRR